MPVYAFCNVIIDHTHTPPRVMGAGIFRGPASDLGQSDRNAFATLFQVEGRTYDEASQLAYSTLALPFYEWVGELATTGNRIQTGPGLGTVDYCLPFRRKMT